MAGLSLKNHLGYAVRCAAAFFAGSCQDDFESPLPLQSYKWLTPTSHAAVYIVAFTRFPHISAKTRTGSGCCHIRLVRVFLVIVWVRIPLPTAPQYSFRVFPFQQACYWGFLSSSISFSRVPGSFQWIWNESSPLPQPFIPCLHRRLPVRNSEAAQPPRMQAVAFCITARKFLRLTGKLALSA